MKKQTKMKLVLLFLIFLLLGVYVFVEPFLLQTIHLEITHPDIPDSFDGFSMVFLTDIHHGPFFSQKRVVRLVNKVNALTPHIVLLGGDYVHRYDTKHIYSFYSEISKLVADFGVYAVMGNHDYWMSEELSVEQMSENNIPLLRNDGVWIEYQQDRIYLGGVDDLMAGHPDVQMTIQDVEDDVFTLLISHHPDVVEMQSTKGVDWVLSGHTHGGQVTLFGLWAPVIPSSYGQKYRSGLVQKGDTSVFISNGVGTITPPVRFFARPQIIYITLHPESS